AGPRRLGRADRVLRHPGRRHSPGTLAGRRPSGPGVELARLGIHDADADRARAAAVSSAVRARRRGAVSGLDQEHPMNEHLPTAIFAAGCLQLCVLIASSLVPLRLNWRTSLDALPRLHRQLYW